MDILNNRLNRRTLGGITIGAAATGSLAYLVSAQDATPEVDPMGSATPVAAATLAELETANQVDVVANNGSFALYVSGDNQPGWYVFNVENASESDASFNLAMLPEGTEVSQFTSDLFQVISGNATELPAYFAETQFAGGAYVPVGATGSTLVNLTPGTWVAFSAHAASTQGVTTINVMSSEESEAAGIEVAATPEGGLVAPDGFNSSFTVSVSDSSISADAAPVAGANTIGVRNDGTSPVSFVLLHSTEAVDAAAAGDLAKSWIAGEEVSAMLAGGMGVLSPSAYGYVELTAEAGTYIGFSALTNATGGSQVDDGAIIVVPVS